ncbi:MAG: response regulator [Thermoleophilaceae bacterium]|nr:response regulator [Thermoleophilaceae bacterium]
MDTREREILLVEDNPGDAELARHAFREAGVNANLRVASDGNAAVRYLRGEGLHADRPEPDFALLDLRMPGMDGFAVLREVKGDPTLRSIPIVVLTTSTADSDVAAAFKLHANAYHRKPVAFGDFVELAGELSVYWLDTVVTPRSG